MELLREIVGWAMSLGFLGVMIVLAVGPYLLGMMDHRDERAGRRR